VRRLRKVNRNFYVQVTQPPRESGQEQERITLYKWWPGDRAAFNINTVEQWEAVKRIVEGEFGPYLKWKGRKDVVAEIAGLARGEQRAQRRLASLAHEDPALLPKLIKGIDLKKLSAGDVDKVKEVLAEIAAVYVQADDSLRRSIAALVRKLPAQGEEAIRELTDLMESLTLHQITAVTSEVKRRVGLLRTFKDRALDDRTYEIRGVGSIHRLLEQAMWLVDERYWLMHSNSTLRTVIGTQLAKEDKRFEKRRPDFVCGTVDKKLIIIELKRPSRTLTVADLNQLERYVVIAQKYDDSFSGFEAILVGRNAEDDLARVLRLRGGGFRVRTFAQLIDDTERRYEDYLKHLEA
jgi:hypothetical protein